MTDKRYIALVNPRSGVHRGPEAWERAQAVFAAAGAAVETHITRSPGHAAELAATLDLAGCAGVCVVGGDGTIHETVSGLMRRSDPAPLGVIPGGSGNALAAHLGISDPAEAARRILAGHARPLDVARVRMGGQVAHCVNIIGWGFVVDISRTAERLRAIGPARYTVASLWRILRPRGRHARVVLDGRVLEGEFLFIAACNTKFTGKGMKLAPQAELDDGVWDVVLVRPASRLQTLRMLGRLYSGTHVTLPGLEVHRASAFSIEPADHDKLNLDGEIAGGTPVTVEVIAGALRVLV